MREQASSTLKSLATIVSGDLTEAVASTTVASWRETLAMILTYAREEEFITLCQQLGERLEQLGARDEALLCSICAVDVSGLLRVMEERRGASAQPDAEAFWALREMLRQAQAARQSIAVPEAERQWPRLLALADAEPLPVQLTAALNRCISDDALLKDESSPELYQVRVELRRLHQSCMRKVKDYAVQYNMLHYLQDEFMTLSSDRYVLPLKSNFKGRMQGIIHDWSQTGETCYFEPMFLVDINNRLQELKHEEREEERKVLAYLADLLRAELPGTHAALRLLAELDLLQAKRALAESMDGRCVPITTAAEGIQLLGARHPLLTYHCGIRAPTGPGFPCCIRFSLYHDTTQLAFASLSLLGVN